MKRFSWLVCLVGLIGLGGAAAEEPKGNFEVHDLSLWVLDPNSQMANAKTNFPSPFPATVTTTRTPPSAGTSRRIAPPVSLIRFYGPPAANLDIDLRTKSGSFVAHWPSGEGLPNRLRWSGMPSVDLVESVDASELAFVDADHWIRMARDVPALYLRRGARAERFLAYDAEMTLQAPLRLQGGPDKYTLVNLSDANVYDVMVSRPTPQGRRVAWIDMLPPKAPAPKPAAAKAPGPAKPQEGAAAVLFDDTTGSQAAKPAAKGGGKPVGLFGDNGPAKPAAKPALALFGDKGAVAPKPASAAEKKPEPEKPAVAPAKAPAPDLTGGVEVRFSEPLESKTMRELEATNEALSDRLNRAGLTADEVKLFVDHYAPLVFDEATVVVACRLDPSVMDSKLPLSIFPEPAKSLRVAIVVVRNADPQLGSEADQWIAKLGDAKYSVREAAQKRLIEIGPLAYPALNKALAHADPEIVLRAERILLNQNQGANAVPQNQNAVFTVGAAIAPAPVPAPAK